LASGKSPKKKEKALLARRETPRETDKRKQEKDVKYVFKEGKRRNRRGKGKKEINRNAPKREEEGKTHVDVRQLKWGGGERGSVKL